MVTNTKRHTEISVTDDSTNITVFGPDPQVRENYDETIKYIRDLELKMRGYAPNEDRAEAYSFLSNSGKN